MLRIELRTSNIALSEPLRNHVAHRLEFALRRFEHRVDRITIRLVDINGPRGGPDKRCRIIVRLSPQGSVIVEATDSDVYAAVSRASARLDESVARIVTRRRVRSRPRPRLESVPT